MFRDLYETLLALAKDEDLRQCISEFANWELLGFADGKLHPRLMGTLTWIGNVARECGEIELMALAREMRAELELYCVPWSQLAEYEGKVPVLVVGNLESAHPAQNRQSDCNSIRTEAADG